MIFLAGKAVFFTLAFGIPLLLHPVWVVLLFYGVRRAGGGHRAERRVPAGPLRGGGGVPAARQEHRAHRTAWAVHQVETTVDFARGSRVAVLAARRPELPDRAPPVPPHLPRQLPGHLELVEETCRDFGVKYAAARVLLGGLASHFRWLRRMGMPTSA